MATEESSLTDFEYRIVGVEGLENRIYNQLHHAKSAITLKLTGWPYRRNQASIREDELESHIEMRFVSRGDWKSNIREVFGLE